MQPGRDLWLDEECRKQRSTCTNEWMGAEDPLFILYTSGSTGKPKGLLHTTGGYLVYAAYTHKLVFDYHPGDVYFCAADVGWITGHSYIVYGPLANGATTVMFESTPVYPDAGRYWRIVDDLGVNIFYTAPTALRALAQGGDEWVKRYRRDSLRILGTRGRADQPRDLALVPRRGGREALRGRRHLVADGDRRDPDHAAAGRHAHQARLGHAAVLRRQAGGGGPGRRQAARGQRRRAARSASRRRGPARRARCGATTSASRRPTSRSIPGYYFTGDGVPARRGRLLLDHRPHRRRAERVGPPARHRRDRERARRARRGGRGRGRRLPARDQGAGDLRLRAAHAPTTRGNDKEQVAGALKEQVRHAIGAFAAPDVVHVAPGPAEDAQRQDHAPHPAQDRVARSTRASATSRRSPSPRWSSA